jgi:HlyD family secretion protein
MPTARPSQTARYLIWTVAAVIVAIVFYLAHIATRTVLQVHTYTVERGSIRTTVSTNGRVQPAENFEAHAPFPGIISGIYVHEGQHVRKGQLLMTLDDTDARQRLAQAQSALAGAEANEKIAAAGGSPDERYTFSGQLEQAQAEVAQAQKSLDTVKALAAKGAASQAEVAQAQGRVNSDQSNLQVLQQRNQAHGQLAGLPQARAQVVEAQAAVAAAQDSLDQSQVRAPFNGTVYSMFVARSDYAEPAAKGDFVQQGDRLLDVADMQRLSVLAYFDEPDIGKLSLNMPVQITWQAKPNEVWHGRVTQMPSTVMQYTTRNVGEAICSITDPHGTLLPDTNVEVIVTTNSVENALSVPIEALHVEQGLYYVYRVQHGKLRRVHVQISNRNVTQVEITSGLDEGDVVALTDVSGRLLTNGAAVRVL